MIFIVEMKAPDTGLWEVAEGAQTNKKLEYANEEMDQFYEDNPKAVFRVVQYFRADEGVKA